MASAYLLLLNLSRLILPCIHPALFLFWKTDAYIPALFLKEDFDFAFIGRNTGCFLKMKMTEQKDRNLVKVQQQCGVYFCIEMIFES